jgi:putative RecB family exonuclease
VTPGVLLLIGQIASGKTTVARGLASGLSARWVSADGLSDRPGVAPRGQALAELLEGERAGGFLVYECTGAGADFEELVQFLRNKSRRVFVVKLACGLDTALCRLRLRPWQPPGTSASWRTELEWTARRLRTVPADLTLDTTRLDPAEVERWITEFLVERDREPLWPRPALFSGTFSYSKLATYERCPMAYRFRYLDTMPEGFHAEETILGQALHKVLAWLHQPGRAKGSVTVDEVLRAFHGVLDGLSGECDPVLRGELVRKGEPMLRSYHAGLYLFDPLETVAVEQTASFPLCRGGVFVGQIDRLAWTPAGTLVVIDYKTGSKPSSYFNSIPDLLQLEVYALAAQGLYQAAGCEARRLDLRTGRMEMLTMVAHDAARIRAALLRWIERVTGDDRYEATPGKPCRWCSYYFSCPEHVGEPSPGCRVT